MTPQPCHACDTEGPDLPWAMAHTDLHRAAHNFGRALIGPFMPSIHRLLTALSRKDTP